MIAYKSAELTFTVLEEEDNGMPIKIGIIFPGFFAQNEKKASEAVRRRASRLLRQDMIGVPAGIKLVPYESPPEQATET